MVDIRQSVCIFAIFMIYVMSAGFAAVFVGIVVIALIVGIIALLRHFANRNDSED